VLDEFDEEQSASLASLYGLGGDLAALARLRELVGGHPYLLRLALEHAASERVAPPRTLQEAGRADGPFGPFLTRQTHLLQADAGLARGLRQVVQGHDSRLAPEVYERLYRAGLVVADRRKYRARCPLVGVLAEQAGPRQPALSFWAGGIVHEGAVMVKRTADDELLAALRRGEFCYVVAPRQVGKSTLAAATVSRLGKEGVGCALIDLNLSGSDCSETDWYADLVDSVSRSLDLPQLGESWKAPAGQLADEAWLTFLRNRLLAEVAKPVVIFLDEIDWLRKLRFGWRFFQSLCRVPQLRAQFPALARLTFCLLGVAPPQDLVRPAALEPVAEIREIWLRDFIPQESQAFLEPLKRHVGGEAAGLLDAILAWAGGNPYMIQRLCKELT
jgi:hypothetical protein